MSQYKWRETQPDGAIHEYLVGYDRPLDYCFLVVHLIDHTTDEDVATVWSNLDQTNWRTTPEQVLLQVQKLGGTMPNDIYTQVQIDYLPPHKKG